MKSSTTNDCGCNKIQETEIEACGNCKFFVAGGKCQRVTGEIHYADLCDLWVKGQPQPLDNEGLPTFEKDDVNYRGARVIFDWPPKILGVDSLPDIIPEIKLDLPFPPRDQPPPSDELRLPENDPRIHDPHEPYLQEAQQMFDESKHPRDAEGKFSAAGKVLDYFKDNTPSADKYSPNPKQRQLLDDDGEFLNMGTASNESESNTHAGFLEQFHDQLGWEQKPDDSSNLDKYKAFDKFRQDTNTLRISAFSEQSIGVEVVKQSVNGRQLRTIRDLDKNGVEIFYDIYTDTEHLIGQSYREFIDSLRKVGLVQEIAIQEAEWDESKHSRDAQGRFGSGGGTEQPAEQPMPSVDIPQQIAANPKKDEYTAKYQEFAAFDESPVGMEPEPIHDTPEPDEHHIATAYSVLMKYPDLDEREMIQNAWQADKLRSQHGEHLPAKLDKLKLALPQYGVSGRVKTRKSMLDKLGRKRIYANVHELKDVSAMRVTPPTIVEVEYVKEFVRDNFKIDGDEDNIAVPKEGYRAQHFDVKDEQGLISELQVRTPNEDKWANFFHDTIYKDKEHLNPEEKKRFDDALPRIKMYGSMMSEYYYQVDQGMQAVQPDCPPDIQALVGCL